MTLFFCPRVGHTLESSRLADICGVAKCPTSLCSRCGTAWCVCSWTIFSGGSTPVIRSAPTPLASPCSRDGLITLREHWARRFRRSQALPGGVTNAGNSQSRGEAPHLSLRRAHFSRLRPVAESLSAVITMPAEVWVDAPIAQLEEQRPCKAKVAGSRPTRGSARLSLRVSPPVDSRALILGGC